MNILSKSQKLPEKNKTKKRPMKKSILNPNQIYSMHYIPEANEESSSDDERPKLKLHAGRYIRKQS